MAPSRALSFSSGTTSTVRAPVISTTSRDHELVRWGLPLAASAIWTKPLPLRSCSNTLPGAARRHRAGVAARRIAGCHVLRPGGTVRIGPQIALGGSAEAGRFLHPCVEAKRVQALLGHSSIQITFDGYGHLVPSLEDD